MFPGYCGSGSALTGAACALSGSGGPAAALSTGRSPPAAPRPPPSSSCTLPLSTHTESGVAAAASPPSSQCAAFPTSSRCVLVTHCAIPRFWTAFFTRAGGRLRPPPGVSRPLSGVREALPARGSAPVACDGTAPEGKGGTGGMRL